MNDKIQEHIDEASSLAQTVLHPPTGDDGDIRRLAEAVLAICGALQNIKHDLEIR